MSEKTLLVQERSSHGGVRKLMALVLALALVLPLVVAPVAIQASVPDGVYSFGNYSYGQLGLGESSAIRALDNTIPNRIGGMPIAGFPGLENPRDVAAGDTHSLVLLHNGDVYSFGDTQYGKLGHGEMDDTYLFVPKKIEGIGKAAAIGTGRDRSFISLENGDLYAFGRNGASGQLGVGHTELSVRVPTKVEGIRHAVKIDGGQTHTLVLQENGDVYGFGRGHTTLGQGDSAPGTYLTPVKVPLPGPAIDIAAGWTHSLVVLENGDVYAFGGNYYGALGLGLGFESKVFATPLRIEGLGSAIAVAAGNSSSFVLLENGDLYSFGYNDRGQLGLGDTEHRDVPVKVESISGVAMVTAGDRHTLAVLENGHVYSWGDSGAKLGHGDTTTQRSTPTLIKGLQGNNALALAAGTGHSMVLVGTPPITIEIDGQLLRTDVPPVILDGRTMVPLRAIFEALDTEVEYDAATRTITGTSGDSVIQLTIDSTRATVNGEEVALDVPATIMEGRTLVPVRFIAESTGQEVGWEARTRTVLIKTVQPR